MVRPFGDRRAPGGRQDIVAQGERVNLLPDGASTSARCLVGEAGVAMKIGGRITKSRIAQGEKAPGAARHAARRPGSPADRRRRGAKRAFGVPSMSPLRMFFSRHSLGAVPHAPVGLATSCGVGTDGLQRPSLRASSQARHPMLSASVDNNWQVCRRRPHLSDGFFAWPGS